MDKWKKKISGALIASVLALTLSSKAYADTVDEPVPDLPVPQYEEKAADTGSSNTPAKVSSSSDKTENTKTDTSSRDFTPESKGPAAEVKSASQEAASSNAESTVSDTGSKGSPASSGSSEASSETPNTEGESRDIFKGAAASENGSAGADDSAPVTVANTVTDVENAANVSNDIIQNGAGGDNSSDLTLTAGMISGAENENGDNTVFTRAASFNLNSSAGTDQVVLSGDGETEPAEQTRTEGESVPAENSGSEEPGTIILGGNTFIPGQSGDYCEDNSIPPANDLETGTTILLGYDAGDPEDVSDDSLYMVNYDGSSQTLASTNSDINILAAGLNRLGSIQADGDVNITGTGILLLDSISISENHNFFLHPIEGMYDSGSVAVFLKKNSSGSVYQLVNGSVPGILDESYTIPSGIDLVMPSGTSLLLPGMVVAEDNDTHDVSYFFDTVPDELVNNTQYSITQNKGSLTVANGASLTIDSGASVHVTGFTCNEVNITPQIEIKGKLTVNGEIKSQGDIYIGSTATSTPAVLSGNGTIEAKELTIRYASRVSDSSNILFDCPMVYINRLYDNSIPSLNNLIIKNSCVNITGALSIKNIAASGNCMINADLTCENISLANDGSLTFTSDMTINGKVTGGTISFLAGSYTFSKSSSVAPGTVFSNGDNCEVFIYNYSKTNLAALYDAPLTGFPRILTTTAPSSSIPCSFMYLHQTEEFNPGHESTHNVAYCSSAVTGSYAVSSGANTFRYEDLLSLMQSKLAAPNSYSSIYFAVHYKNSSGKLCTAFLDPGESISLPKGSRPLALDGFYYSETHRVLPANASFVTQTSSTGSGLIGGSGAGSISGGSGIQIDLNSINNGNDDENDSEQGHTYAPVYATGMSAPADNSADDQTNDNSSDQEDNSSAAEGTYITPEDIKPDVKPEDLVITVTEQETVSVSSNANSQAASAQQTASVSLEEAEPVYTLAVTVEDQQVTKLNEKITVRFSCPAPKTSRQIFAVFRNADGSLKAFKARYDKVKKQLVFDTDMLGDFAVVCIDYKGALYSEEFYEYLETFDSVKALE